jgi:hypothetical protein
MEEPNNLVGLALYLYRSPVPTALQASTIGDRTFRKQTELDLNVGLTVFFWCHKKIHPSFWKTEADRDKASLPHILADGLHMQMVPGEGEVWDTCECHLLFYRRSHSTLSVTKLTDVLTDVTTDVLTDV